MSAAGGGQAVLLASYSSVCKPRWPNAEAPPPAERRRSLGQFVSSCLRTLSQITAQIILYSPVYDGSWRSSRI